MTAAGRLGVGQVLRFRTQGSWENNVNGDKVRGSGENRERDGTKLKFVSCNVITLSTLIPFFRKFTQNNLQIFAEIFLNDLKDI